MKKIINKNLHWILLIFILFVFFYFYDSVQYKKDLNLEEELIYTLADEGELFNKPILNFDEKKLNWIFEIKDIKNNNKKNIVSNLIKDETDLSTLRKIKYFNDLGLSNNNLSYFEKLINDNLTCFLKNSQLIDNILIYKNQKIEQGNYIWRIFLSPNGKRLLYKCVKNRNSSKESYKIIEVFEENQKESKDYKLISNIFWSNDSSKYMYLALSSDGKKNIIINGEEIPLNFQGDFDVRNARGAFSDNNLYYIIWDSYNIIKNNEVYYKMENDKDNDPHKMHVYKILNDGNIYYSKRYFLIEDLYKGKKLVLKYSGGSTLTFSENNKLIFIKSPFNFFNLFIRIIFPDFSRSYSNISKLYLNGKLISGISRYFNITISLNEKNYAYWKGLRKVALYKNNKRISRLYLKNRLGSKSNDICFDPKGNYLAYYDVKNIRKNYPKRFIDDFLIKEHIPVINNSIGNKYYNTTSKIIYFPKEKCFAMLGVRDNNVYLVKFWTDEMKYDKKQ